VHEIRDAVLADDAAALAGLPVPESYRGVVVRKDEAGMFAGTASRDKDPRLSLHLDEVPTPELGPGEAIVAVMASSVNFNTVWTSIFEPVSTFGFLERYGRLNDLTARTTCRTTSSAPTCPASCSPSGPGVSKWHPGDKVVAHCLSVELEDPQGHDDTMMDPQQRIWGFETNFGGLAELRLVKTNQLMPKPAHLTWEEAAAPGPGQLHRLPPAREQERRGDEAGRHRPDLGRERRPRVVRHAVRPQRRRRARSAS
jgi:crotonyl-CoA reductase